MRVACVQAECTRQEQPRGRMAFVRQPREAVERRLASTPGQRVWFAVELTSSLSVVSGVASEIEALLASHQREGVRSGYLPSGFAFHSPLVDTLEPAFRAGLASLRPKKARLPIFSAADERQPTFGVDHWWRIMREPATFRRLVRTLLDRGAKQFVEVGPEPILMDAVCENIAAARSDARVMASLRRCAASAADVKRAAQAIASS
jgi:acyl transferase domain-containing protein